MKYYKTEFSVKDIVNNVIKKGEYKKDNLKKPSVLEMQNKIIGYLNSLYPQYYLVSILDLSEITHTDFNSEIIYIYD